VKIGAGKIIVEAFHIIVDAGGSTINGNLTSAD
jgi:hypothetical protein